MHCRRGWQHLLHSGQVALSAEAHALAPTRIDLVKIDKEILEDGDGQDREKAAAAEDPTSTVQTLDT